MHILYGMTVLESSHALQGLPTPLSRPPVNVARCNQRPEVRWRPHFEQVTIGGERYNVVSLRAEDPAVPSPIPPLYEPVLLGFFTLAFRLRGFESVNRGTSSFGVVQEWHCEMP
jgi:hypothetical protein